MTKKEIYEELNITVQPQELIKLGTYFERNVIFDVFIVFITVENLEIKIQKEELSEYKWISISDLEKLLKQKKVAANATKSITLSLDYLKKHL